MLQDIISGLIGGAMAEKFIGSKLSKNIKLLLSYIVCFSIFLIFSIPTLYSNFRISLLVILSGIVLSIPMAFLCIRKVEDKK